MDKLSIWKSLIEKCTLCGELWSVFSYASKVFDKDELSALYFYAATHFYYFPVNVDMKCQLNF